MMPEGPDDMPAHIKSMLTATSLHVPVLGGKLALGTWQAIYLIEHRRTPHRREIVLQFIGAPQLNRGGRLQREEGSDGVAFSHRRRHGSAAARCRQ